MQKSEKQGVVMSNEKKGFLFSIDQSFTSTGYVIVGKTSEVQDFGVWKTEVGCSKAIRATEIAKKVVGKIIEHGCEKMVIEGLAYNTRQKTQLAELSGLYHIILAWVFEYTCLTEEDVHTVPAKTAKKFFTGSGAATKDQVIEQVPKEVLQAFIEGGIKNKNRGLPDVCDAYSFADYYLNYYLKFVKKGGKKKSNKEEW